MQYPEMKQILTNHFTQRGVQFEEGITRGAFNYNLMIGGTPLVFYPPHSFLSDSRIEEMVEMMWHLSQVWGYLVILRNNKYQFLNIAKARLCITVKRSKLSVPRKMCCFDLGPHNA